MRIVRRQGEGYGSTGEDESRKDLWRMQAWGWHGKGGGTALATVRLKTWETGVGNISSELLCHYLGEGGCDSDASNRSFKMETG